MKTQSNKKQSILLIVFLVAIMALAAIFFTACMSDEEAFNKYGREKAFWKNNNGSIIHVAGNRVDFYLDSSLRGDILSATKYAIAKANTLTSKITITGNGSADSKYSILQKDYGSSSSTLGTTFVTTWSNGEISTARVELYSEAFPWYSGLREIKYTAMHEIGHVLGLTHPNSDVKDHSVMVQSAYAKWPRLTDYGKFDRENIKWYYE